jgi:hypothetical protein
MVALVWTTSATTLASASTDSKGNNATSTSTSACPILVKMAPLVTSTSIRTLALVRWASRGSTVRPTTTTAPKAVA